MEDKEQKIKLTFETNAEDISKENEKVEKSLIKVEEAELKLIKANKALDSANNKTEEEIRALELAQRKAEKAFKDATKELENDKKAALEAGNSKKVLAKNISELDSPIKTTITGFKSMVVQMWAIVANPIGAIIAAIVGVFALLYEVLRKFDPVMDAIEQGFAAVSAVFDTLLDGVLSLITGAKSLGDVFSNLGGDIKKAANEAVEFTKIQQELDDLMAKSTVNQAKYNRQINELILQSKDRTKTEAERIKLIDQALKLEETAFLERKRIADDEVRIAQNAIISGKNLTAEQKRQLKQKGVDYAISLKDSKRVTDEEVNALAAALAKQEDILNQSVSLREKALNRKYALEDAAVEKEKQLQEKAEAARKKSEDERAKREEAARIKREKDNEAYFQKVIELAEKERFERERIAGITSEFDKQVADEKEKLRQEDVANEVRKGQLLAAQVQQQTAIDQAAAKQKQEIEATKVALAEKGVQLLASIFGKSKKVQKAAMISEGAISIGKQVAANNTANIGALATPQAIATSGAAAAPVIALNNISTGIGIASTIASTAKALQSLGGGSAPSAGNTQTPRGGGGSASATPQVSFQASRENQIATSVATSNANQPPIQAFVVGKQVTTQQNLDNNKIKSNSI